jgi:predicted AlkP superfamily phosphohydrolase/phosphomutase
VLRGRLARELSELTGPHGERLSQRVVLPERAYRAVRGFPPELLVFFDDLNYRAIGSVGHRSIYTRQNDTGPDACNHDWNGVFIFAGPGVPTHGLQRGLQIYDVAQTVLGSFGLGDRALLGRDWSRT